MPDSMDGAIGLSTPEPLFMDKGGKKPVLSTKMAVFVDEEAGLSTIRDVYVDKWQKNRHPSTYKPDSVDGETGSSMKTALYVDDSGAKAGMIFLKEVDAAYVTNIFLLFPWCVIIANSCVIIGIRAKSFTEVPPIILILNVLHFINSNTPKKLQRNFQLRHSPYWLHGW